VWWCIPVVLALRKLNQEDYEFKVSLDYIARPCLKTPKPKERKRKEKDKAIALTTM
jgi:hypothetical protein